MPAAKQHYKVAIIGSGPAGYTAGIYTSRANLDPILISGDLVPDPELSNNQKTIKGGQLMITSDVENYPGFPHGVLGPELMVKFEEQAKRFGTEMFAGLVTKVDLSAKPFKLELTPQLAGSIDDRENITADVLIISTGANARLLPVVENDIEMMSGHGVSACATCDGWAFKDKHIVVIGGGDSAMEEANYLTKFGSKVTVVHRREGFRASKIMSDRAKKNEKIEFLLNKNLEKVHWSKDEAYLKGIVLKDAITNELSEFSCEGLFIAIGHSPNTPIFGDQLELDDAGYIKVSPGGTQTSITGVLACGDVQDHVYRQAITAAGTGCMAAIDAERYLEEMH